LAELISNVLANPQLQLDMRKRGIDRAATFSWKNCALETIAVYKSVIAG
jgi:glycosyltransferase involved in cell wall biosynthesis